ncbi:hypothetical protein [Adhaeribacter terreus]|uniref:Uncharacterized protein n=1 Tax=Adhaeribacter terreus TaxID=529703 RepID=A0ABW0EF15_9BACT
MTPEDFIKGFYNEKEDLLQLYFNNEYEISIGKLINSLNLKDDKKATLYKILEQTLTDSMYTILLGLDGAASIRNRQEMYKLLDEEGNELTGGEIESYAWEYFHSKVKKDQ